jgi:hypothetical protein
VTTAELLAEYALLLNRHGPDSPEAAAFVEEHRWDVPLMELCETSYLVKKALTEPPKGG